MGRPKKEDSLKDSEGEEIAKEGTQEEDLEEYPTYSRDEARKQLQEQLSYLQEQIEMIEHEEANEKMLEEIPKRMSSVEETLKLHHEYIGRLNTIMNGIREQLSILITKK